MSDLVGLVWLFLLVLVNGFFVAAEFALVSVRRTRVDQLANEGSSRARLAQRVLKDLDLYIAATQLGITMASLGIGFLAEPAIEHLTGPTLLAWGFAPHNVVTISFIVAFSLSTALHIVFGELAPKSLALQRAEQVSMMVAIPLIAFGTIFRPVIWVLNATGNGIVRMFGLRPVPGHHSAHSSEEEIRMIVASSRQEGVLEEQEKELLNNVFDLSDTPVRGIMTPRVDMIAIEETAPLRRLMVLNEEHGYSRVPIFRDTTDNIVGVAYIGDILRHLDHLDTVTVGQIARPTVFAPENMKVLDLFPLLQRKKTHLAIVVDEFGGTAGIVTLEDAVEEVVGEIYDENDDEEDEKLYTSQEDGSYLFDATINCNEVEKVLGIDLDDEIQGNYETLSGFLFHQFEYIPRPGEETSAAGWTFHVAEADERRVLKIRAFRQESVGHSTSAEGSNPPHSATG
jgi:putative hemolysin